MSKRAWALFIALAVIWGLPYFFIRIAVRDLEPATLVFLRTGLASLILLPFALHRRLLRALLDHWPAVLGYTFTEITVPWLLLSTAEQRLTSSLAGLLIATAPIFGAVIAWALGHERPGGRRVLGLALGFAGVVILAGVGVGRPNLGSMGEVVLCSVGYAVAPMIVARRLAKTPGYEVVTASMVITALVYLPFGLAHLPRTFPAETAESVAMLSVVCTVGAFLLFFALIREIGPTRAMVVTYVNPAVAVLLGVAALGEPFTLGIGIGFPMIIAGSILATWSRAPRIRAAGASQAPGTVLGGEREP
ncbi:MAG: EamA family transporter [Acidimicrobiales bacterium]|jgi:drug/metabolite transporter (DMT)-like permease